MLPEFATGILGTSFLYAEKVDLGPSVWHHPQAVSIDAQASKELDFGRQCPVYLRRVSAVFRFLFEGSEAEVERPYSCLAACTDRSARRNANLSEVLAKRSDVTDEGSVFIEAALNVVFELPKIM
jgi:hypothetical protein